MIICGIELSGSEARLVLIKGMKSSFSCLDVLPRKISLNDDENADEIKAFRDSLFTYFRENKIQLIAIKKRAKKGDYAGGAVGFKIEGIVQLYEDCPVRLVSPQSISAASKKSLSEIPTSLKNYQYDAFKTAFAVLG
jgi:hypothetical protein